MLQIIGTASGRRPDPAGSGKKPLMYRHIFGPVPSRRLGISLGVDLVPMKTCSLNCIYCECGRTTDLTVQRREYVPVEAVKAEIAHYLAHHPAPDYVTFSGSGEPTLHAGIGEMIRFVRSRSGKIPVAVLTNGTLLYEEQLQRELHDVALVIPSLDAATISVFRKINRPNPNLSLDRIIDGLIRFSGFFGGRLWLEVFIVPGLNDTESELAQMKRVIEKIDPDRIQLNTLDRPGTVSGLRAATGEELRRILDFWKMDRAEIIARAVKRESILAFRRDISSAILETIRRRPCTLEDLTKILGLHANEVNKYLDILEANREIGTVRQQRGVFYHTRSA